MQVGHGDRSHGYDGLPVFGAESHYESHDSLTTNRPLLLLRMTEWKKNGQIGKQKRNKTVCDRQQGWKVHHTQREGRQQKWHLIEEWLSATQKKTNIKSMEESSEKHKRKGTKEIASWWCTRTAIGIVSAYVNASGFVARLIKRKHLCQDLHDEIMIITCLVIITNDNTKLRIRKIIIGQ